MLIPKTDRKEVDTKRMYLSILFPLLIVFLNVLITMIYVLSKVTPNPLPLRIHAGLFFSSVVTSFVAIIKLALEANTDSISGMVAQRLKSGSYLTILLILYMSVITSSIISFASEIEREYSSAMAMCSIGPLFTSLILVFPIVVEVNSQDIDVSKYINNSINPIIVPENETFKIYLYPSLETLPCVLHHVFVIVGYLFMVIGWFFLRTSSFMSETVTRLCLALVILSIIFMSLFLTIPLLAKFSNLETSKVNMWRIWMEYSGLIFMIISIGVSSLNITSEF